MKMKGKKIIRGGIGLLLLSATLFGCQPAKNEASDPSFEISFPSATPVTVSEQTKKTYDAAALQAKLTEEEVYLYSDPEITDYAIVSVFGFSPREYSVMDGMPDIRWYRKGNNESEKRLEIDKYGCFLYAPDVDDTWFEFPFDDEQTIRIAEDFLKEYELWVDGIACYSIDNTVSMSKDYEKIVARNVVFFQKVDGKDICGNQRISVEINGNGEVTRVNYNVRKYQSKHTVTLIPIEEAIQNLDPEKAYVSVESTSEELIFEDVEIAYWTSNTEYDTVAMQPVYIFSGTSVTAQGETEPFSITVQANVVSSGAEE